MIWATRQIDVASTITPASTSSTVSKPNTRLGDLTAVEIVSIGLSIAACDETASQRGPPTTAGLPDDGGRRRCTAHHCHVQTRAEGAREETERRARNCGARRSPTSISAQVNAWCAGRLVQARWSTLPL